MHLRFAAFAAVVSFALVGQAQGSPLGDVFVRLNQYLAPTDTQLIAQYPAKSKFYAKVTELALEGEGGVPMPLVDMAVIGTVDTLPGDTLLISEFGGLDFDRSFDQVHITSGRWQFSNVLLPPVSSTNPLLWAQAVGGFAVDNLHVEVGRQIVDLDRLAIQLLPEPEVGTAKPTTFRFALTLTGLALNDTVHEFIPPGFPGSEDLSRETKADLYVPLFWDIGTGMLSMDGLRIDVPTRGSYRLGIDLAGITIPLLEDVVRYAMKAANDDTSPMTAAEEQAFGLKILSEVSFDGGYTGLSDSGIVANILDGIREREDIETTEAQAYAVAEVVSAISTLGLSGTFLEASTTAISSFFTDGGSLVLTARPVNAARLIELVALAGSPSVLVERLALETRHVP